MIAECDDYANSIQVPQLIKASILQGGEPEMNGIRPVMYTGGFCVVFPYSTSSKKYAVRCWHAYLEGTQERAKEISKYLNEVQLPYFVDFQYVEEGIATPKGVMPLVVMDWVEAQKLKEYIQDNINKPVVLDELAKKFIKMVTDLHHNNISHGDLQHENIMVKPNGDLVLVDYDSVYVPNLGGFVNEIEGKDGYQHPAKKYYKKLTPKADYFSELVIYTSIIALSKFPELWDKLKMQATETMLFSKEDIYSKGYSWIFEFLSQDPYLKQLVTAIRNELSLSSIDDLSPLEEVEPNMQKGKFLKELSEQWGDNGYKPQPSQTDTTKEIEGLRQMWNSNDSAIVVNASQHNQEEISKTREEWN